MRIIVPGHIYAAENVDGTGFQLISFVRRRNDDGELLPLGVGHEGILTQELLRIAIDRTLYLNAEAPCAENVEIVDCLRKVLSLYESRAARKTIEKLSMPERAAVCPICRHILCGHSFQIERSDV